MAAIAALRSARNESCATTVSCISGLKWRKVLPSASFASYIATSALRSSSSNVVDGPAADGRARDGDPDAALDRGLSPIQPQGSADRLEQLSHDLRDLRLVRDVLEQNRELVAAQTGSGVALAQRGAQTRRDGLQHSVPGVVAERVVDVLEVVEIQEQNGEPTDRPCPGG